MDSRFEVLPGELNVQIFSFVSYEDAVRLDNDRYFRALVPDLLDRKSKEYYRSITVLAPQEEPDLMGEAQHRTPFEALVALEQNPRALQYVQSFGLMRWRYEAQWEMPVPEHYEKSGNQSFYRANCPRIRQWAMQQVFPEALLKRHPRLDRAHRSGILLALIARHTESYDLPREVLKDPSYKGSLKDVPQSYTAFSMARRWISHFRGTIRHSADLLLLISILPNLKFIGHDCHGLRLSIYLQSWDSFAKCLLGVSPQEFQTPMNRLKALRLSLNPGQLCPAGIDLECLLRWASALPELHTLILSGFLYQTRKVRRSIRPSQSVRCLGFHRCQIRPSQMRKILSLFPRVHELRFEGSFPQDLSAPLQDAINSAFDCSSSNLAGVERLRIGRVLYQEPSPSNNRAFGTFNIFPNLRALDIDAPTFASFSLSERIDALPIKLELLRLQDVCMIRIAREIMQIIERSKAKASSLTDVAFSSHLQNVVECITKRCRPLGIHTEVTGVAENWIPFQASTGNVNIRSELDSRPNINKYFMKRDDVPKVVRAYHVPDKFLALRMTS